MQNVSLEYSKVKEAADYIKTRIDEDIKTAIILGSGLGGFGSSLDKLVRIKYEDVPNMPVSTVKGHKGEFCIGEKFNKKVLVMEGRIHYYEGYTLDEVIFPIRVFKLLGIEKLIITNSSGAVNLSFVPGDLMFITDHINLSENNALIGQNAIDFGERFPSMSEIYSKKLLQTAQESALELNIKLQSGIYFYCTGPSYETPAEIRAIRVLGGDCVGMSTVYEAVAAKQMGMDILGISCITNMAAGILDKPLAHNEVIEIGKKTSEKFSALLNKIIKKI